MAIVVAGGKTVTPAQHMQLIMEKIKHIFASKKYPSVYREVVWSHAPGKMVKVLAKNDNFLWKIL